MISHLIEWVIYKLIWCPPNKRNCEYGYHKFNNWGRTINWSPRAFCDKRQTRVCKECGYEQERHF